MYNKVDIEVEYEDMLGNDEDKDDGEGKDTAERPRNELRKHVKAIQQTATRVIQHAHTKKETKYYTNQVFEGVRPLALTAWGYTLKAADHALPFKDMVRRARGDKKVTKQAGLLKNKWMKRVSLVLLDINAQLVLRAAQPLETVGV